MPAWPAEDLVEPVRRALAHKPSNAQAGFKLPGSDENHQWKCPGAGGIVSKAQTDHPADHLMNIPGNRIQDLEGRMCTIENDLCTIEIDFGTKTPDFIGISGETGSISFDIDVM